MKRHFFAFFIISLAAEMGTTWFQKLRTTTDVGPGLYYPNFRTLLLERLLIWFFIFLILGLVWIFAARRWSRS